MRSVGLRELKNQLGKVLARVRNGESVLLTDRNRPLAVMVPVKQASATKLLQQLAATTCISWSGGKPRGLLRAPRVRGPSVADAVIEDRR